jgi:hypothetical protein
MKIGQKITLTRKGLGTTGYITGLAKLENLLLTDITHEPPPLASGGGFFVRAGVRARAPSPSWAEVYSKNEEYTIFYLFHCFTVCF